MSRTRGGLAALLTAAALIAPAALAAPAHASTTESGCTVTPHKPTATGDLASNGQKEISYKLDISCSAGRSVYVTEERWENDNFSSDDFLGSTPYNIHFNGTTTVTKNWVQALPTDGVGEGSDYAEVYESVSFYVVSDGNPPVTSPSTWWEFSPTASIRE
ncbi:MAG TPA: hypothetical protein VH395_06965 [Jatrophihabitantaceae bacterium]|jgi:hypothetical protein